MLGMSTTSDALTTGMREIADSLGGGIKEGSLTLIEGDAKAGKSVLSQYIAYGVLCSKDSAVALYTLEKTFDEQIEQMESLALDIRKEWVTDRFRVFPLGMDDIAGNVENGLRPLFEHISGLPARFRLVVVDSITPLLLKADGNDKVQFLHFFKQMCVEQNRSVILASDTHLFEGKTLVRAHDVSDYYLKLRSEDSVIDRGQVDDRNIKVLEVTKLNGADRPGQGDVKFEVKPRVGIQILPLVRVRV